MADLSLRYMLYGEDKTASKAIKGVGAQASSTGSLVAGGLSKMGNMLGGEVGEMMNRVSMGFDQIGEKSKGMGAKMVMGGTAVMGLGLAMQAMASKPIESMKQLNAAVEATGKGYEGFAEDVEKLIQKQVAFGHTDEEVTTSLRVLTQAYGDPKRALGEMNLVTDLAAAKHISLAQAAGIVAKAHGGAGKVFREFGIVVGLNKDGTKDYDGALTALSGKLAGQATAGMDSFGGKVKQVRAWLENQASTLSAKYGPAVTIAGGAVTALGSVMQVMAARAAAAALANDAATASTSRFSKVSSLAGASMAGLAMPLAIGAVALGYFAKQSADSAARVDQLSATLDAQTGALTTNTRAFVAKTLAESGALTSARNMGISASDVTDAVLDVGGALSRVKEKMAAYEAAGVTMGDQQSANSNDADKLRNAIGGTNGELGRGIDKIKLVAQATTVAAAPVQTLAEKQKALAAATKAATDKIAAYHQALVDAGLVVLSTRDAIRQQIQAVADSADALKKNGKGLDENTQKGRDNQIALDNQATKALDLAKAVGVGTNADNKMRVSLLASRASLVATAINFGMTKAQANTYADSILKIPPYKKTTLELEKAAADAKITALQQRINSIVQGKVPGLSADGTQGRAAIAELQRQIDTLRGKNVVVNVQTHAYATGPGGSGGPVAARGTSSFAGGLIWVGEEGPELARLPRGTTISSNQTSRSMMAGGGSGGDVKVFVNGQVYGSTKDLANVVLNGLQQLKGQGVQLGLGI